MNILRRWIKDIDDQKLPIRTRLFKLIMLVGLSLLIFLSALDALIGNRMREAYMLLAGAILLIVVIVFTDKFLKIDTAIRIIGAVLNFCIFPVCFFYGGGLMGGSPFWIVMCIFYASIMMYGRERKVFVVLTMVIAAISYWVAYSYPYSIVHHGMEVAYVDSLASGICLSALISLMLYFQHNAFQKERRLSEEQQKKILEMSESQNKFFSSMSHEIRTPINTIIGLNEMTLRENISEEVAENSMHIQAAPKILLSLINDILDMSKIESGNMSIVRISYNVADMLSEIVNMIWVRAQEKGLEFHVDVDSRIPAQLMGDDVRIKQILVNILNNAVKYTDEGSVTFTVQCDWHTNTKANITYIISDTGSGIKKESIPYLFSAFKRVDEGATRYIEGTGLGLSIVKQLVDLMGGEVTVNSIYTKGSTFTVSLPQDVVDSEEIGEIDLSKHRSTERVHYKQRLEAPNARVLVVDDNDMNLLVADKLLRHTKVMVETAESGAECLHKALQLHYDLIFMDHLMPEMDGVECLHQLRAQNGGLNLDTPVIVLTANAGTDMVAMYRREGFDECILKPVTGEVLEDALINYLPKEKVNVVADEAIVKAEERAAHRHTRKRSIIITTESVCDLPQEILKQKQIEVIPFDINIGKGSFMDGVEIYAEGVMPYLMQEDVRVLVTAPTTQSFEEFFARMLETAQRIIHISASRKMARSYDNAMEASMTFENVTVIDSENMSGGIGIMALKAAELAEQDKSVEEICEWAEGMKEKIRTSFVIDDVKYVTKSGRAPKSAVALCQAFMMHPVVELWDGSMKLRNMVLGSRERAWRSYISGAFSDEAAIDKSLLFICYSMVPYEDLQRIAEEVRNKIKFERVVFKQVSSASSVVFGEGAFGFLYAVK